MGRHGSIHSKFGQPGGDYDGRILPLPPTLWRVWPVPGRVRPTSGGLSRFCSKLDQFRASWPDSGAHSVKSWALAKLGANSIKFDRVSSDSIENSATFERAAPIPLADLSTSWRTRPILVRIGANSGDFGQLRSDVGQCAAGVTFPAIICLPGLWADSACAGAAPWREIANPAPPQNPPAASTTTFGPLADAPPPRQATLQRGIAFPLARAARATAELALAHGRKSRLPVGWGCRALARYRAVFHSLLWYIWGGGHPWSLGARAGAAQEREAGTGLSLGHRGTLGPPASGHLVERQHLLCSSGRLPPSIGQCFRAGRACVALGPQDPRVGPRRSGEGRPTWSDRWPWGPKDGVRLGIVMGTFRGSARLESQRRNEGRSGHLC